MEPKAPTPPWPNVASAGPTTGMDTAALIAARPYSEREFRTIASHYDNGNLKVRDLLLFSW